MSERFHIGTFLWGFILTLTGAALAAVGFGWWEVTSIDLRYIGPLFVTLVGIVILLGAVMPSSRDNRRIDNPE